jgi:hypothetical protein
VKRFASVVLLTVIATACSSSKPKATTTTSSTIAIAGASDQDLAKKIVLNRSDVPADWSSTPNANTSSSDTTDIRLTQCLGLAPGPLIKDATRADSDSFTSSTQQQASASVRVAKNEADVTSAMKNMSGPKFADCVTQLLTQVLNGATRIPAQAGTARVAKLPFDTIGNRTVAYRVTVPVSAGGQSASVDIDFVVAQVGRVAMFFDGTSVGAPFPSDMSAMLLRKMVDRAKAAA